MRKVGGDEWSKEGKWGKERRRRNTQKRGKQVGNEKGVTVGEEGLLGV